MADEEVNFDELNDLLGSTFPTAENAAPDAALDGAEGMAALGGEELGYKTKRSKKDKKHKKKKKRSRHEGRHHGGEDSEGDDDDGEVKRSRFVIDAAESGDSEDDDFVVDDEEDDDEEAEEGYDPEMAAALSAPRRNHLFHEGDDERTAEELEEYYKAAVRRNRDEEERAGDENMDLSSRRLGAKFFPREDDPKVFAVKCRPRMARVLVSRIVNKCYAYRVGKNYGNQKVDLGIISVFALDHVKEYIYVEASRKRFVENVLNGLDGVFRFNIAVVDPMELLQTMESRPTTAKVRVGDFVRLRQRFYRSDLAQVTSLHSDGSHMTVKVVPREDFVKKTFNKPVRRLPPRFFSARLAFGVREVEGGYLWGDCQFDRDGYLLKTVSTRMAISGSAMEPPSTEELARFFNNNRDKVEKAITAADAATQVANIHIGDSVRITSGQLRNVTGTVENIYTNTNTALLLCPRPGSREMSRVDVELSICAKHFIEGTHVVVERGDYTGEAGTVIKSMGEIVLLLPDRTALGPEIKVQSNDCHQSKLSGVASHSKGIWQLFDLVTVADANCVGCIVRLNRNDADVLTEFNDVRTLTYTQMRPRGREKVQTSDPLKNIITRGVEVHIQGHLSTPAGLEGHTGRVEHVFNRTLFVRCPASPQQANIVALSADCVLLVGGRRTDRREGATRHSGTMAPPQAPLPRRGEKQMSLPSVGESAMWDESSASGF